MSNDNMKRKQEYIDKLKIGDLIAFSLFEGDKKLISGKVTEIYSDSVNVQTKNGTNYMIEKINIAWVNTSGRWPKGVLDCFKIRVAEGDDAK